jgi:hypothetical protein
MRSLVVGKSSAAVDRAHEARLTHERRRMRMATRALEFDPAPAHKATQSLGMRVYWTVVALISLALLGMTVHVATPPDAAELVEAQARP